VQPPCPSTMGHGMVSNTSKSILTETGL